MNHPGMPITWKEVKELGLEEVPPGYEPSDDEQQPPTDGNKYDERKDERPS